MLRERRERSADNCSSFPTWVDLGVQLLHRKAPHCMASQSTREWHGVSSHAAQRVSVRHIYWPGPHIERSSLSDGSGAYGEV